MSIKLSDTQLRGYRSQDLELQRKIDQDTLFAVHHGLSSWHSSYGTVSSDVKISALAMMKVGSMAFEETWEYSPSAHSHGNYTDVSVQTRYGSAADGSTIKVGTLSVSNTCAEGFKTGQYQIINIYCPVIQHPVPQEPAYGTLRFMYSSMDIPVINAAYIGSTNFDGWVFPDGSSYTITPSQFTKAGNPFVTYDSNPFIAGDTLRVPDLRDQFLKLNPFTYQEDVSGGAKRCRFAAVASHSAVPRHSHPIDGLNAKITLTPSLSESSFKSATGYSDHDDRYAHHGTGNPVAGSPFEYNTKINFNSTQINLKTRDASQSPIDNYPNHWALPVMIYVGGRRKEYEKVYLA